MVFNLKIFIFKIIIGQKIRLKAFSPFVRLFFLAIVLCMYACKEKVSTPETKEREEIIKEIEASTDSTSENNEEMEEVEMAGGGN